nr:uncharacterized protein LOC129531460 [Gorilla gorilla gorilla]
MYPQEASEEPPAHKDRGDGERPVDARVVQVAPLRFGSALCWGAVQDISEEDTVYDICNEDAVDISDEDTVDISNEAPVHDISNEAAVCDISKDAVNISEAAVRDISNDAVDICNEAVVHDISNEDTIEDISYEDTVYDITNEDAVQYICKKEDATKEPLTLENDLIVESISDDEDFAAPCGSAVQDISEEDTVYDICNDAVDISDEDTVDISNEAPVRDISNEAAVCDISKDAVNISEAAVRDISNDAVDICNEAVVHDISNEDTIEDISYEDTVYDITNEDAVQYICKKEDATKEPLTLENDLIVESISDDEDFAAPSLDRIDWAPRPQGLMISSQV